VVFPDTTVSFTNKNDRHDITEILLKVALNTITLTITLLLFFLEGGNIAPSLAIKLNDWLLFLQNISKKFGENCRFRLFIFASSRSKYLFLLRFGDRVKTYHHPTPP
jgi:hypothetical protein